MVSIWGLLLIVWGRKDYAKADEPPETCWYHDLLIVQSCCAAAIRALNHSGIAIVCPVA